jgi:hypothetical protein
MWNCMVGEDRPAASASCVWDQPKCALAAADRGGLLGPIGSVNREAGDALEELGAIRATRYRTTNQRVTLLLLQPVDRPSTGNVGRVSLSCVSF